MILTSLAVRVTFEALEKSRGDRNRKTFNIMYSLSFLIVELETARTALLDVFEVSNGTPNWTWHGRHLRMGCAAGTGISFSALLWPAYFEDRGQSALAVTRIDHEGEL